MLEGEGCVVPMLCCFIEGEKPFMVQLLLPQMCRKEVGHHLRDVKSSKEEEGSTRKRVKRENLIPVEGDEDDEVFSLAPIHRESLHGCSCDYREADERKPLDEAVNSREQQESLSAEIDDGALHGQQVYARLADIDTQIDMVDVFRAADQLPALVDEILALPQRPKVLWGQLSVRHDAAAQTAEANGIEVIMDRCPAIEYPRLIG